jgi:hypothetical protein
MSETYDFPDGFAGGMRIDLSPDKIPSNASPSMVNCNFSGGGVPTKRFGYSKLVDVTLGSTPIQAMTEFKTGSATHFLIVCGGAIYKKNEV